MKLCKRCVLPETFPGIKFDDEGVCNFCDAYDPEKADEERINARNKFEDLILNFKGKFSYDCTLSYSGGKDSTYTLYLLKSIFKLNVLALTFDNGFLSEQAFSNIRTITENLGTDSIIFKANFQLLKEIYLYAINNPMYPLKALERASSICTSCIGLAKVSLLKIAIEKKIPMMAWGWTPGQAPIRSSIMKINPVLFKATQESLKTPMQKAVGNMIDTYFLDDETFRSVDFPYNVHPLAFMEYSEDKILETIQNIGWKSPKEVDANSTNCLLNSFANRIHIDKYHFHPYAFEIAGLVRIGVMQREDGLKKIEEFENEKSAAFVRQKLGYDGRNFS